MQIQRVELGNLTKTVLITCNRNYLVLNIIISVKYINITVIVLNPTVVHCNDIELKDDIKKIYDTLSTSLLY